MNKRNTGKPGIKPDDEERLFRRPSGAAVARYIFLPGILPRIQQLYQNSFSSIAYLIAVVYHNLGLIPAGHPFANPGNIGRYGVRHVVALAADNLVIDKRNMDKIILFLATLLALVLIAFQVIILFITMTTSFAWADPGGGTSIIGQMNSLFITENPEQDIAFRLLDQVFAIPGLFNSADAPPPGGIPPINSAMHEMFELYNYGVLFVGGIIFLYYIMVVVFETAQTGVPFGRRFDNVWVPIRLVVAIGLLLPINYGLNSAQYISLYLAKLGSSFATNTWLQFNDAINDGQANGSPLGYNTPEGEELVFGYEEHGPLQITAEQTSIRPLIAKPEIPSTIDATKFGVIIAACIGGYNNSKFKGLTLPEQVRAFFIKGGDAIPLGTQASLSTNEWKDFVLNELNGNVILRMGVQNEDKYPNAPGNVGMECGEWQFPVPNYGTTTMQPGVQDPAFYLHQRYFSWFVRNYVQSDANELDLFIPEQLGQYLYTALNDNPEDCYAGGMNLMKQIARQGADFTGNQSLAEVIQNIHANPETCALPSRYIIPGLAANDRFNISATIKIAYQQYLDGVDASLIEKVRAYGWGGAGVWYNNIADLNGNLVSSTRAVPKGIKMPELMDKALQRNMAEDQNVPTDEAYCSGTVNFENNPTDDEKISNADKEILKIMCAAYKFVNVPNLDPSTASRNSDPIVSLIDNLTGGAFAKLFSLRENTIVHPLAQISAAGKALVESSMNSLKNSIIIGFGGSLLGNLSDRFKFIGNIGAGLSGVLAGFVFVTLTGGVILYYVLPLMPFLYFFFAVVSWVMSVFEAMVGVPLWALAHLRVEGKGFIPQDASQGYFMLMEIFLRPVLIVFGLIATTIIFFTELAILQSVWDLVIMNVGGVNFDEDGGVIYDRGPIDKLFFTVMYIVVVFLMATATFKLIDAIPNQIMRWFGAGVTSFAEQAKLSQAVEQLPSNIAIQSMFSSSVTSDIPDLAKRAGAGIGQGLNWGGNQAANRVGGQPPGPGIRTVPK